MAAVAEKPKIVEKAADPIPEMAKLNIEPPAKPLNPDTVTIADLEVVPIPLGLQALLILDVDPIAKRLVACVSTPENLQMLDEVSQAIGKFIKSIDKHAACGYKPT